ncbi:MAG: TetR/AcrR family transcriptional regulator [Patescibacteria group bacterium]|nr:TetR/AcrR family transcriptional regulator [Patescibacteria group bacterium]
MKKNFRHIPTQRRSRSRVASILRSSEKIFSRVGYEAATTNAIADNAKIPIGSLYQYFRNKQAILRALAEQYIAEYRDLFIRSIEANNAAKDHKTIMDYIIDVTIEYYQEHPAFMVVFYGAISENEFAKISEEFLQELIKIGVDYYHRKCPNFDRQKLEVIITVLIKSTRSIFPIAVRPDGSVDERYRTELKRLATAYFRSALEKV